jgi:cytochrome d ubiquinol oxidase subunit II
VALALIAIVWTGFTAYAILGGADFGAGVLHLIAPTRARDAITAAIGPFWEANHVWLIFGITGLFSAFPRAFDALGTLAFVPGTLALVAVVVRGAGFAVTAQAEGAPRAAALFRRLFGGASVAAPFFFGVIAGGLARGARNAWLGPFQAMTGLLAVAVCTALATTFMTVEARRAGDRQLAVKFRGWALWSITAVGALAIAALALAPADAPTLFHGLTHRALPEVVVALAALSGAHTALRRHRYGLARAALVLAVGAVMWGWAFAQYPRLVGGLTVASSAAGGPELTAVAIALASGLVVLAPSLWVLFVAFRRQPLEVER